MPIKIVEGLPVIQKLNAERVYIIEKSRALSQRIRPLRIVILNLMPKKEETELQILRLLGNTPLQIEVDFMYTKTHFSVNTPMSHLQKYYVTHDQIKDQRYDGLIVTGAPVEHLDFQDVDYIDELNQIMNWAQTNVYARYFICWAAQYALHYYYNIEKIALSKKLFGIYSYKNLVPGHPFLRGFDDQYRLPQSRYTRINFNELDKIKTLIKLSTNEKYGPDLICTRDKRDLFTFGHLEYDRDTLKKEYERDLSKNHTIAMPENYFPEDNPAKKPNFNWKSHAYVLFNNWLNETYQNTPYDLKEIVANHELVEI